MKVQQNRIQESIILSKMNCTKLWCSNSHISIYWKHGKTILHAKWSYFIEIKTLQMEKLNKRQNYNEKPIVQQQGNKSLMDIKKKHWERLSLWPKQNTNGKFTWNQHK